MDRRVQDDGTIVVGGQVVPTGGSQPTIASVVSYSGNANLQSTNVEAALDELDNEKAPLTHTHDDRYFTEVEITNLLASKSDTSHNHDTRYYTESEVDAKIVVLNNSINGKANAVHDHDDRYYTEAEVDEKINNALASTELHDNPKFDIVTMSTVGPGSDVVPARLYPSGWGAFWGNGDPDQRPVLSADNVEVHTPGGYSLKMVLPGPTSGQTMNGSVFGVSPGAIVTVEAWFKGNGPYGLITVMTNKDTNPDFFNPGTVSFDTALVVGTSTWQKLTLTITVPGDHNRCRMMVRGYTGSPGAPGTLWWDDTRSSVQIIPPSGVVTGEIKMWPTAVAPSGYLLCNGGTFSSDTYPALAAILGDTFGTHSGTTYYLPDFRGRSPIGVGSVSPSDGSGYSFALGNKFGTGKHFLTLAEIPNAQGEFQWHGGDGSPAAAANGVFATSPLSSNVIRMAGVTTGYQSQLALKFNLGGGGGAHNITHPVLGINYIIKAA